VSETPKAAVPPPTPKAAVPPPTPKCLWLRVRCIRRKRGSQASRKHSRRQRFQENEGRGSDDPQQNRNETAKAAVLLYLINYLRPASAFWVAKVGLRRISDVTAAAPRTMSHVAITECKDRTNKENSSRAPHQQAGSIK
jgi:hypothetical protein